jgi:hypothetical protein
MIKFIKEIANLICGEACVHAAATNIKGSYSAGKRDMNGKDWYNV